MESYSFWVATPFDLTLIGLPSVACKVFDTQARLPIFFSILQLNLRKASIKRAIARQIVELILHGV